MRELVDHCAHFSARLGGLLAGAEQQLRLLEMAIAKALDGANGTDQVSLRRLLTNADKRVRHTGERRDDDDRLAVETRGDDAPRTFDRFRVADGRAAELENEIGRASCRERV